LVIAPSPQLILYATNGVKLFHVVVFVVEHRK